MSPSWNVTKLPSCRTAVPPAWVHLYVSSLSPESGNVSDSLRNSSFGIILTFSEENIFPFFLGSLTILRERIFTQRGR